LKEKTGNLARRISDGGERGACQVVGDLANRIDFSSGQRQRGI
jgi:hypothetical protein